MPMRKEDVIALRWQGGGGIGDPIDRDPAVVWQDVSSGLVSETTARAVYGVVGTADGPDVAATEAARASIRAERIGRPPRHPLDLPPGAAVIPFADGVDLVLEDGAVTLRSRGHVLVTGTTRWRSAAIRRPFAMPPDNPPLHPDLAMTAFYCPHTGALLAVDVHLATADPVDDVVLDLPSLEALAALPAVRGVLEGATLRRGSIRGTN